MLFWKTMSMLVQEQRLIGPPWVQLSLEKVLNWTTKFRSPITLRLVLIQSLRHKQVLQDQPKLARIGQIGGQVGIVGHITIGDNVKIQGQSGIIASLKDNEVVQGTPSMPYNDYYKSYIHFKNLPNLVKLINGHDQKLNHE